MLVLSRKTGQQIQIGDQITLTIVKTQGKTVRIGIEAPKSVRVVRAELEPLETEAAVSPQTEAIRNGHRMRGAGRCTSNSEMAANRQPTRPSQAGDPNRWSMANMRDRVRPKSADSPTSFFIHPVPRT